MAQFPLQTLLDLTQQRFSDAERRLQQANALLQAEQQKLNVLQTYRREYEQKLLNAQQGGLSVTQWRDFQLFISKLDTAIDQQQTSVQHATDFAHSAREQWDEQRKKLKGFETLADQHRRAEDLRESRREQKQSDEFAAKSVQQKKQEAADQGDSENNA